jgi:2-dehydro-3-deoxyphosphogluconate aldolase/(4S)-4-hydroxy-2-oxoglutarate aldolase
METIFGDENRKKLADKGIIAVIVIEDPTDAAPLARALVNGGVTAMELTLRTPVAMEALKTIIKEVPEMKAGVGTYPHPRTGTCCQVCQGGFWRFARV